MNKDKCIIKSAEKPSSCGMVRVTPDIHQKLQELARKTGRGTTSIAKELLEFALERVEIEYNYED